MRKKLFIASSLDGYIARKDGSIDWLYTDGDYGFARFYDSADTIVMGRRTYEKALVACCRVSTETKGIIYSVKPLQKREEEKMIMYNS